MLVSIQIMLVIGLILMTISIVGIFKLIETIKTMENAKEESKTKRIHPVISEVDFDNVLTGRTEANQADVYKKYKNKDGLYEPVMTKNGIEIKPRKED